MEIIKYLNRIHAVKKENPSLDYLTHLQEQHILNIHFENLDILNKRPISLEREDLFRKMVLFERGGVCYELNGLFYYMLNELGFAPELMTGTVHVKDDIWGIENGHLFMIVHLNNKEYIVDVGLGAKCPRVPVPMNGEIVTDSMGDYRVKEDKEQRAFDLEKKICSGWKILYRFGGIGSINALNEIYPICYLTETSPQSIFNQKYFLSRELRKGRITLLGNTLTRVNGKEVIKEDIEEYEIAEKIKQYFQINVSKV